MDECKRGFASRYIHKHGHADSKATFKGNARHEEYEKMVYEPGFIPIPPTDMSPAEKKSMDKATRYVDDFLKEMRLMGGTLKPEVWVAINRDGSPSKYGAPIPPYIRVKTDLYWSSASGKTLGTFDWKSGTWMPDESEVDYTQTILTSIALLKSKPNVKRVIGGILYTAKQRKFPISVMREEIESPHGRVQDVLVAMANYEEIQRVGDYSEATRGRWCAFCRDVSCAYHPSI